MRDDIAYIIPFVRPWEVPFMCELVADLKGQPWFQNARVRYLTMWKAAELALKQRCAASDEVVFIPEQLNQVDDVSPEMLHQLDQQLTHKTGTPLRMMLDAERYRPAEAESAERFLAQHVAVVDKVIEKNALVISNMPDHLVYWLACDVARLRGGRFFGFQSPSRPSGWTAVQSSATELWQPYRATRQHHDIADQEIQVVASGINPSCLAPPMSVPLTKKLQNRWHDLREFAAGNYFVGPEHYLQRPLHALHQLRWRMTQTVCPTRSLDEVTTPFFYLALHLQPEASTSVFSPLLRDEAYLIECIAKALPACASLVIKENPKMWGVRPTAFYKKAAQLPGVIWIDPQTPSHLLNQRTIGTLSIAGSSTIEAFLLGKPAALFGCPTFCHSLPGIVRITQMQQLPQILAQMLSGELTPSREEVRQQFADYVANLLPASFLGSEFVDDLSMRVVPYNPLFSRYIVDALSQQN